ncbi:hypothetical protein JQU17_08530 [Ponticoccus sp. SC2-23]|uniref:hypothetical protein n=1 Tax=Alexandriicola marinus TaxID=2081710 RepID=UPI000FDB47FC|nr:hypothetical protein [Alexandriicola marinus]MBM1220268.1 hypothetical protein [Ponticoccus sp. SC6-9]MBM1224954.1 hypothetical protein [Ponticoccus sp. SC6-15]MBM1228468.1 hypothetical protein [Ponticoccus sp. SC6-38]MBM1233895.1 hypothetical protein [Ponticoccus sp. SC6-45]MBM1238969.1 hypothetical protein [Ponticoccus sp. SC6-49]MBM1242751.1 hypothetical protein [Ponticoccus sp. SC2-64]MBM1247419.1 hypothetical protein [Ponticoccus sp. SC6-42]MBM1251922.1 hypothetical protein [Pontico
MIADGLLLPALVLALVGWLVPRGLSLVFPEGVKPLLILAFVSTVIMFLVGSSFFVGLYLVRGVPMEAVLSGGLADVVVHFGRLGLISALLWGPIMILSVAGLPKHWVEETW